jgi:hypothetical protein
VPNGALDCSLIALRDANEIPGPNVEVQRSIAITIA